MSVSETLTVGSTDESQWEIAHEQVQQAQEEFQKVIAKGDEILMSNGDVLRLHVEDEDGQSVEVVERLFVSGNGPRMTRFVLFPETVEVARVDFDPLAENKLNDRMIDLGSKLVERQADPSQSDEMSALKAERTRLREERAPGQLRHESPLEQAVVARGLFTLLQHGYQRQLTDDMARR
jgi:uncharacterized protein YoaH (UPF0181 family)